MVTVTECCEHSLQHQETANEIEKKWTFMPYVYTSLSSQSHTVFGRPFVKWFALNYQTVVCLCVCLWRWCTVAKRLDETGMQVGLGPGHTVLDGDPATPPQRGTAPKFRPISVVAKWLDEDATWYGGRPQPRRLCVRWGLSSPCPKMVRPPIVGPCLLWPVEFFKDHSTTRYFWQWWECNVCQTTLIISYRHSLNNPSLESRLLVTVLAESDLVPSNVNYTVYMEINW